jgi:uroporphyrinogen-III decarboxylase
VQFQFVEKEYMLPEEYDLFIERPVEFILERYLPRIGAELEERRGLRARLALVKSGMAFVVMNQINRERARRLETEWGMPQPMAGSFRAPFDVLGDGLRGLKGIIIDLYRRPEKVLAACERLVDEMVAFALSTADPLKRYPIFVPTHKACFLSPKQFDTFYWPSFKKVMERLIAAGYTIRAYLEGDWSYHWHHFLELPKGTVLCDIDTPADIVRAKREIGHHQCLAGGVPDPLFIWGTPEEMRERVKFLCQTVGGDGGFIIGGGCNIPYNARPENFRALIEATLEYGTYRRDYTPRPRPAPPAVSPAPEPKTMTPWEVKRAELGEIPGDAELIRRYWEMFEQWGYTWVWQWVLL